MSIFEDEKQQKVYEACKDCVKAVSGFGIGILFGAFTQTYMPVVGLPIKAAVWVGTKIFTGMINEKAENYIDNACDETAEMILNAINEVEESNGDREAGCSDKQSV